jgi:hypothetical protein
MTASWPRPSGSRPMTLVILSDQPTVTALLQEIAQLCAGHGAQWHHELQVEVVEGGMRLLAPPGTTGPLITLPTDLLVHIAEAQWSSSPNALDLVQPPAEATPLQRELLQLHTELYNATGKLHWWSKQHPARLGEASSDIAASLELLKPGHRAHAERSAAEGFLATRSFGWRPNPEQQQRHPVLMPLIDLLNHHHQGAPFRIDHRAMQIKTKQAGGRECFAHYGHRRDVLDLALHYGHYDSSTPFAHSAPLEIDVEGIGRVLIQHQGQRAPVHPFDPPHVKLKPDGLRLSHLCCHRDHPERVQTMLSLALQAQLKRGGHDPASALRLAQNGLNAIGEANVRLLDQLAAAAQSSSHPGAPILAAAAQHQASIIKAVLHQ